MLVFEVSSSLSFGGQISLSHYMIEGSLTVKDVHIPKRKKSGSVTPVA